ncbi:MAG: tRNA (N6-isopentenyl adenosine(37)-C2)-methylthiotransferase MiaB [Erysipelotrichaceae bacterium]|nr:tRNA (N6-isopentenyl adenosine(37)-C2)-methylthiotransferase MiaB [Erysipelotrichaceae bacterium]MDD3923537.1 tRNA (N6-isopentenyl adenosine(37)-C2)-methylthiotransferase MiaB [Erysipelotrichaceae bacterium]MDD4642149.1 tRNA (N6-isopentenyl adenosine(37)-C2)-methylthiotransferase MiaB [Erysipelotrichaceae bacterium]
MDNKLPSLINAKKRSIHETEIQRDLFYVDEKIANLGSGKTCYLRTYGCQANERDSETIAGILKRMGFTMIDDEKTADMIILNTCAIRKNAEDKVFGEIGYLKQYKDQRPELIIALCGCMAQEEAVIDLIIDKYPQIDLVFGTHNIYRLPQLLHQVMITQERVIEVFSKEGEVIEGIPTDRFIKHKAWVNIIYGCNKFCTYCIVPYTRGKERSRLLSDIIKEVSELKENGYKEITLLGQNVNAYGKDLGYQDGFSRLLEAVAQTNIERIRFTTSHPWDFTDETIDIMARYDNIMPFLHLPVQSGNNEILKLMGRRYTIERYKEIYDRLKKVIPNCSFSTDIIVGFPNETEEQFNDTLELYDYCQFDNAYTFIYSPREGTPAAQMEDNVSYQDKQRRLSILNEKVDHYAKIKNEAYLNKTVKVLVDGLSKKNKNVFSGYTQTNKLVNFIADEAKIGTIIDVLITDAKTWSLNGKRI